jgi:hypothetical protein
MRLLQAWWTGKSGDPSISIHDLIGFLKDYWFLVTVALSALASIFYMLVFRVTPLDKYYEIRDRRERVQFHNSSGKSLLEHGYYAQARTEFQTSLDLESVDAEAMNGRYLSDLFLQFDEPDWNPQIGIITQEELHRSRVWKNQEFKHVVAKYRGDVAYRTFAFDAAKQDYQEAMTLKPDYIDCLLSYGWFNYFYAHDISKMTILFQKTTELAPYDYRGFHGFGYALYIQAIKTQDPEKRKDFEAAAADMSRRASNLGATQLSVLADFGEIARPTNPWLSISYHEFAQQIEGDPKMANLPDNTGVLGDSLLTSDEKELVSIEPGVQKRAWITYQLALDHLALCDLEVQPQKNQLEHDRLVDKALQLDGGEKILAIYNDQLRILRQLAPGRSCRAYSGEARGRRNP